MKLFKLNMLQRPSRPWVLSWAYPRSFSVSGESFFVLVGVWCRLIHQQQNVQLSEGCDRTQFASPAAFMSCTCLWRVTDFVLWFLRRRGRCRVIQQMYPPSKAACWLRVRCLPYCLQRCGACGGPGCGSFGGGPNAGLGTNFRCVNPVLTNDEFCTTGRPDAPCVICQSFENQWFYHTAAEGEVWCGHPFRLGGCFGSRSAPDQIPGGNYRLWWFRKQSRSNTRGEALRRFMPCLLWWRMT